MGRSPLLRNGAPRANSQLREHFRRFNQPCYGLALWDPVQSPLIGCRVAGVPLRNRSSVSPGGNNGYIPTGPTLGHLARVKEIQHTVAQTAENGNQGK